MKLSHDRARMRRITEPRDFGRVAVLFGGSSTERDISLLTGRAVLAGLQRRDIDATGFDPRETPLATLAEKRFDRVFIALHGPGGEDGTLQGALEFLGLPYTGSGVLGSAVGMDKLRTKRLAAAVGIPTPHGVVMRSVADSETVVEKIGLPLIVKPGSQGSSVGMSKVDAAADLPAAYERAAAVDDVVFAEPWISGAEYTVAVLHRRALPAIRIETARSFYDYEAKYLRDDTKYHCPSGLSAAAEAHMASLAIAAFDATGAEGWGRADFMADQTGRPQLLEINTVPGMTDHSLVPMAARAAGIDFDELCWQVLETSFVRERVKEFHLMFGNATRRRNRRRPEGSKRQWRVAIPKLNWRRWGGLLAAAASIGGALLLIRFALDQPIEKVAIQGRFQRVSPLDVEKAVRDVSRGQGLVALDLDTVGLAVRRLSWVDTVAVRRSWPRGLAVSVVEQVPVARWGETGLLNTRGELFVNDARYVPPELPELTGPPGSEGEVTRRYLAAQGRLVEAGMRLSSARLDPRGAWEFRLDNGVTLRLGRRQVDERFDRFMNAAARLVAVRANDIDYIDLRYTNGFAVGWRGRTGTEKNSG